MSSLVRLLKVCAPFLPSSPLYFLCSVFARAGLIDVRVFIAEIMVTAHSLQRNTLDDINAMPLYPTEALLWDDTVLPLSEFQAGSMLALPKLNLQVIDTCMRIYLFVLLVTMHTTAACVQFLTFQDYLLRSFQLFRLESAYEIREDIADATERLSPKRVFDYETGARVERVEFQGWSRMAMPVRND